MCYSFASFCRGRNLEALDNEFCPSNVSTFTFILEKMLICLHVMSPICKASLTMLSYFFGKNGSDFCFINFDCPALIINFVGLSAYVVGKFHQQVKCNFFFSWLSIFCRLLEKQWFYKNPLSKAKTMYLSGYIAVGKKFLFWNPYKGCMFSDLSYLVCFLKSEYSFPLKAHLKEQHYLYL